MKKPDLSRVSIEELRCELNRRVTGNKKTLAELEGSIEESKREGGLEVFEARIFELSKQEARGRVGGVEGVCP